MNREPEEPPKTALTDVEHEALTTALAETSEVTLLQKIGVSRVAFYRAMARMPTRAGTIALMRLFLERHAPTNTPRNMPDTKPKKRHAQTKRRRA